VTGSYFALVSPVRIPTLPSVIVATGLANVWSAVANGAPIVVDVRTDVSAAAAHSDASTGVGAVSASAGISRDANTVMNRGLAVCGASATDPNDRGCLWLFTGVDHNDVDQVRASIGGSLAQGSTAFDQMASLRLLGNHVEQRLQWQPQAGINDPFWRSGRGLLSRHIKLEFAPMWTLGNARWQFSAAGAIVEVGKWYAPRGGSWNQVAWDRRVGLRGARYTTGSWTTSLIEGTLFSAGVASSISGDTQRGRSTDVFTLDMVSITHNVGRHLIKANGGFELLEPISDYVRVGNTEHSSNPATITPRARLAYQLGDFSDAGRTAFHIDAGTWSRVSPSGVAVDTGYSGNAGTQWSVADVQVHFEAVVGKAKRKELAMVAPEEIMQSTSLGIGQRFWFARGEASLAKPVGHGLTASLQLWVERSDRDNPQNSQTGDGNFRVASGAQASLGWAWTK
jgi:hypothetical protein